MSANVDIIATGIDYTIFCKSAIMMICPLIWYSWDDQICLWRPSLLERGWCTDPTISHLCLIWPLAFICPSVEPPRDNQIGISIDILEGTKSFDFRGAFNLLTHLTKPLFFASVSTMPKMPICLNQLEQPFLHPQRQPWPFRLFYIFLVDNPSVMAPFCRLHHLRKL